MNTTSKLLELGQSIWYDNIQRNILKNGEFAGMIERGEIRGVTSNPSIFMNAITKTADYDNSLVPLAKSGLSAEEIFYQLAIEDIREAADFFSPLYKQTNGGDGFVSLEVNPYLANDTEHTLAEAKLLWKRVARPNLMIKIPATKAGIPAITEAIAAGINVNITLIFSLERYGEVMEAYIKGLEKRVNADLAIQSIASVASFFVSRVDTNIDLRLKKLVDTGILTAEKENSLAGKAAIANARLAYMDYLKVFQSERFLKLKAKGAQEQRPLWASTSTKNPAYRDVMYVEELIGANTVNTVPPQTLVAFLDHGKVRATIGDNLPDAKKLFQDLQAVGITMKDVTTTLEVEGVKAFADAFTVLIKAVEEKRLTVVQD
ncbi:MAG: transaldolase [Chloroflexi bacterium HGW-Chloroflexi-8]|nr:MAG: transaldolase [Chloroflexi bacterium HGW-Chloroflexi-8]